MKIISGHQPAYLPWLGYFHKLNLCDVYVYMDTVQYLENDWINRNKIRTPDGWLWLTLPVDRKRTEGKHINQIYLKQGQDEKNCWQLKHWKSICANYAKTKYFAYYKDELESLYINNTWERLVDICWEQLRIFNKILGISTIIVRMSEVAFTGSKDRLVLDHCLKLGGDVVVFGPKGRDYVDLSIFQEHGIKVYFQRYKHPGYQQRFDGFEPHMCILDLIFNYGPDSLNILMSDNTTYPDLIEGSLWE